MEWEAECFLLGPVWVSVETLVQCTGLLLAGQTGDEREGRGGRRGKPLLVWKLLHWTGMGQTHQIHVLGSDVANKNKGYPIKFEIQISKIMF